MTMWQAGLLCLGIWNMVSLIITFGDKRAAKKGSRRTPERRFLFFAATLGGIGVLAGFYTVRHKTRHRGLLTGVWTLTALTFGLLITGIWLWHH